MEIFRASRYQGGVVIKSR